MATYDATVNQTPILSSKRVFVNPYITVKQTPTGLVKTAQYRNTPRVGQLLLSTLHARGTGGGGGTIESDEFPTVYGYP